MRDGERYVAEEWLVLVFIDEVQSLSCDEVKMVMVDGKILVQDGNVLTADEQSIRKNAQVQANSIAEAVVNDPIHKNLALLEEMDKGNL